MIEATPQHPFWVVGRGWMDAADLRVGDTLLAADGTPLAVYATRTISKQVVVYNFTVATRFWPNGSTPLSPHDVGRSCISHHLAAGTDIVVVAAIVGHASVQTTARYDRRGERAKQEAANNLHVMYTSSRKRT